MINWIKKLFEIVRTYESLKKEVSLLEEKVLDLKLRHHNSTARMLEAERTIIDRTSVNTSVSMKDGSYIIVVGKYNGMDYVESFILGEYEFNDITKELLERRKLGRIDSVDAPPSFKAGIRRHY